MKKIVAAALLSAAVISGPAIAQTAQPAEPPNPPATVTPANTEAKMALKGQWRASKLMGLSVYNEGNEKLGDINELILDKNGKVNAVVLGIGGFLGMGEHDIAVSMDKLKFVEEPMRTSSTRQPPPGIRRPRRARQRRVPERPLRPRRGQRTSTIGRLTTL